jgi:hypothetical protein
VPVGRALLPFPGPGLVTRLSGAASRGVLHSNGISLKQRHSGIRSGFLTQGRRLGLSISPHYLRRLPRPMSRMISRAALCPGAPLTPPPG